MRTHNNSSIWFTLDYKIAFFFPASSLLAWMTRHVFAVNRLQSGFVIPQSYSLDAWLYIPIPLGITGSRQGCSSP
ncbi:TPA: tryptophanase leader peptide [Vibrio cholerae]|nr:tryptophanase leader peptide [Vibrio cholerae]